jgi:hypothetical protein
MKFIEEGGKELEKKIQFDVDKNDNDILCIAALFRG